MLYCQCRRDADKSLSSMYSLSCHLSYDDSAGFKHMRKRRSFQTRFQFEGERKLYRCPVLSGPLESNLVLVDREQTELLWTGPEPKQHLTIAYLSAIATAGLLKLTHTTTHTASHYYILLHKVKNKRPKGLKCQVDRLREVCQSWILLWPGVGPVLWVPLLCHCWPWSRASRQS